MGDGVGPVGLGAALDVGLGAPVGSVGTVPLDGAPGGAIGSTGGGVCVGSLVTVGSGGRPYGGTGDAGSFGQPAATTTVEIVAAASHARARREDSTGAGATSSSHDAPQNGQRPSRSAPATRT